MSGPDDDKPQGHVRVHGLYKIFGSDPARGLGMLQEGKTRPEIYEATGMTVAVHDAEFSIERGEVFVVMGLSGSGKSTLLRLLNRLIEPTSGKVYVGETEVTALGRKELIELRRREMSMVFQSFALMPHLKVWQNAAFGLEVAGISQAQRRERAMAALEQVGLGTHAEAYPQELSGGMQQRVGLARALAVESSLLLMDEAFSALDPLIRQDMQNQLLQLQHGSDRTVVFISHDLDEAIRIGDRLAIMHEGRVLQVGTPEEILHHPADEHVRSFFGGVDVKDVMSAGAVARRDQLVLHVRSTDQPRSLLQRLRVHQRDYAHLVASDERYVGSVTAESLLEAVRSGAKGIDAALESIETLSSDAPLDEATRLLAHSARPVPVLDEEQRYVGSLSKTALLEALVEGEAP